MKLLIFIHSLSSGGAERVVTNMANYWAENGWQITIVTVTGCDDDFYPLHSAIHRIGLSLDGDSPNLLASLKNNFQRILALRRVLQREQPDIALAMMTTANILLALAVKGLTIPVLGSERTYPPKMPLGQIWEWLRRRTYCHLTAVVALTTQSAEWIKENTTATKVPIIPNAVSFPLVSSSSKIPPPTSLGSGCNLIAVGRLGPEKGYERLLRVFAELSPRFPHWQLTILGEGESREMLENLRQELGLVQKVSMPGRVGNLADWYQAADLYVMTSLFEGFPNTVVEAMAHGLPAISVDCDTGPRDIIRHEVDGLLVPQDNHHALVDGLARLMDDKFLRQQYAARAIEVRERFSMEKIAGMWKKLFLEIS